MRGRVEQIPEPGAGPDGGGDPERIVLGELEDFKVVEDDRLGQRAGKRSEGMGMQKNGMAAEAGAEARDGGGGAGEGARNLAMCGAGLEEGGDGTEQLRALQIVKKRKTALGEGAAAAQAEEPRYAPAVVGEVGAMESNREAAAVAPMLRAGGPGAEAGPEILHAFKGGAWPAHEPYESTMRASVP